MKPSNIDEIKELVIQVKAKDEEAFVKLYSKLYQKIYFLALSIVKDEYLAQDVVQETFISVYKNISSLENDRTFVAWVNRIAYNCSLKILNSKSEIPIVDIFTEEDLQDTNADDPLTITLSQEYKNKIMDYILALPPEFKTTLVLRYYDDLKIDEIALVMDCSSGTVKSRLNRAKKALRKNMYSERKTLSIFMLSVLSIGFTMKSAITSYAAEHTMEMSVAEKTLQLIQQKYGMEVARALTSIHVGNSGYGVKKIIVLVIGGLTILGGSIFGFQDLKVHISGDTGAYTNQDVSIQVILDSEFLLPIQSISLTEKETRTPVTLTKDGVQSYRANINHNGSYSVEVNLMNGKTVWQEFEVSRIDKEKPKLYWYSWDTSARLFYGLITDNLSGVNFEQLYLENSAGKNKKINSYDSSNGKFEMPLPDEVQTIKISDMAGNQILYEITPNLNLEEE